MTPTPSPMSGLPPELAELDAELSRFAAAERPSFAPELESELEGVWAAGAGRSSGRLRSRLTAASVAALVVIGAAVPPARASLADGLDRLLDALSAPTAVEGVVAEHLTPTPRTALPASVDSTPAPTHVESSAPPVEEPEVVETAAELPAFIPSRVTYPTLIDEDADRRLIQDYYPPELQRGGVGGTVRLLLWVAEDGSVDHLRVQGKSGVPTLDRAALQGAGSLRFNPATRDGRPVGTYVEFDLVFTPAEEERVTPRINPVDAPVLPDALDWELADEGPTAIVVPQNLRMEARDLLVLAIGGTESAIEARLGSLDRILAGEPPPGASPLAWRNDAIRELERATTRDPDNPAPVLALARIRRKQGLRAEARTLLTRALDRTERGARPVSPRLVAELNHELGDVVRESWWSQAALGTIPESALVDLACSRRDDSGSLVETLVAWNFVCPAALEATLQDHFAIDRSGEVEHERMLQHFAAAVEAFPGHVGSNVAILLEAADAERWLDVLSGARRFTSATRGHPWGRLLEGLALQRLRRSEEAMAAFDEALPLLGAEVAERFIDTSILADEGVDDPWRALDPIILTEVNEREVEHRARAAYAYLRFGDLESDAAEVWLRYGRPLTVRSFGSSAMRTEFWDFGPGPDLTFSRPGGSPVRTFTPEAAAYLDDLRSVFPEWYGTRARTLYALPSQVARYRGDRAGWGEVAVHVQIPAALQPAPGDSVRLGFYVLGADGTRMVSDSRWVREATATHRADYGPDAQAIVVEVYDPHTRQAAGLRVPAFQSVDPPVGTHLSDLLLVEGTGQPLARADVIGSDATGVLFEAYGLPGDGSYRMWVELASETSQAAVPVSFRAESAALFTREWRREPASTPAVARQQVELDLSGVPPDIYTLRVFVEDADGVRVSGLIQGMRVRTTPLDPEPDLLSPGWDFGDVW